MELAADDSVQLRFEVSGVIIRTVTLNHSPTAVPEKLAGRVSLVHSLPQPCTRFRDPQGCPSTAENCS
jgi:hypothetical protein